MIVHAWTMVWSCRILMWHFTWTLESCDWLFIVLCRVPVQMQTCANPPRRDCTTLAYYPVCSGWPQLQAYLKGTKSFNVSSTTAIITCSTREDLVNFLPEGYKLRKLCDMPALWCVGILHDVCHCWHMRYSYVLQMTMAVVENWKQDYHVSHPEKSYHPMLE